MDKKILKNKIIIILVVIAALGLFIFSFFIQSKKEDKKQGIKIGVSVYKSNDTFVAAMVEEMENAAKEYERQTGIKVNLEIDSAKENQRIQNDQIERYISLNYDVICVNLVDRTNASIIIDSAMEKNIPIVFFNREPVFEDIFRGENIYYVGSDAKETAILQGEILIDAIKEGKNIDKNGDGKLQYIMLEGEMGHQDAIIRTEWSVQTLKDSQIEVEKLESAVANWERSQALALMEQWTSIYGEKIEVVLCNNDDMALGAAEALQNAGIDGVSILGIDATEPGIEAVKEGRLLGTVDCNAKEQGTLIFKLAAGLADEGRPPNDVKFKDERYLKVSLKKIVE